METLRYVVLANGLLLVVSVAYYALLRRETFFGANRLALWLGVVAALGLPLLTLPDWRPQPVKNVMYRTAQVIVPRVLPTPPPADVTITIPNGRTYPAFGGQLPAPVGWSWQRMLVALYEVVTVALLVRLIVQLLSLRRLINQSEHEPYTDFVLVRNETAASPFSFFRWVVVNPDNHAPDELEQILRHERVHVRARHSMDMLAAEVLSIFLWFNPAVYLFRHLLYQTLEFAADRAVLNEGIDARAYQYNLVKVSLAGGRAVLCNSFGSSGLKQRIGMMNRRGSGPSVWARYVLWAGMLGLMGLACRHKQPQDDELLAFDRSRVTFRPVNATRVLANEIEQEIAWFRQSSMANPPKQSRIISGRKVSIFFINNYPRILCLRQGKLALKNIDMSSVKLFVNGQETDASLLATLLFDSVSDLFIYEKQPDVPGANATHETYRILIGTTHQSPPADSLHHDWEQYMTANAVSDEPGGSSHTFSMNKLLEATFFHDKKAFVGRTKNEHLVLLDDYEENIDLYINGLAATPKDIKSVHIREVDRLYTRERPYKEWTRETEPLKRFVLYIETAPKRAKRDSTYYVFSPFYSGDF